MALLFISCSNGLTPCPSTEAPSTSAFADASESADEGLVARPEEPCPWCGIYVDGSPDVWSDGFEGMQVIGIAQSNEYGVYYIEGGSVADNLSRASCDVEMWADQVGDELVAAPRDDDTSYCLATIRRTKLGIRVETGSNCYRFCGAAAGWGGDLRRLEPAEPPRWRERSPW